MISGLLQKTLRETWKQTLLFGLALLIVEALLTAVLPTLQKVLNEFLVTLPFIRTFLQALLGSDLGGNITAQMLHAIVWIHPVVVAIVWAQEIVFCTRVPAGEIDRGTIDVLLSWPASRRRILLCDAAVWLASGALLVTMGFAGHYLAALSVRAEAEPPASRVLLVLFNLYCVYIAVGGLAYLFSALSDRRGRAMAAVFAVVLASFLLSFVAIVWPPAARLAPLGILSYYQPAQILATGRGPWGNMAWLVAAGAILWLAACETFARRTICTV